MPEQVLGELSRQMINHRGPEFARILADCTEGLKKVFKTTRGDILFFPSSGTGMLESSIVNTLSPGDKVLGLSIGWFGQRFAEIARRFGADVTMLEFELGSGVEASVVADKLRQSGPFKAVLLTHNETSTGVTNDVRAVAEVVKPTGALLFLDSVSGLGAVDLETEAWGVDCVATGSQKALMLPPGLGFLAVSAAAWEAHRTATMPRYYWDWTLAKQYQDKGENPYTPPVSLYFGLKRSLDMILEEGLDNIFRRHEELAEFTRQSARELGLKLFAEPRWASSCVTAIWAPEGVNANDIIRVMEDKYDVILAGGQGHLSGKVFRIGHLGWVHREDIAQCMGCLRETLVELGHEVPAGVSVA
ncbi:MAG: pyridoxal-phosphate-dependent aminotransferase family protein [Chloroflexota bacterium]